MKNKKGFTLIELIAVIVVLALLALIGIPAYSSIRKSVLEKQYQNLVALIETNATKLASSKDTNLTNVQELIDEGLLETDDGEYIYDPRDKSKMNCFLIEIEYEKGNYKSKLLDTQNCNLEEAKKEFGKINIIATGEESKNEIIFSESENNWVKENVTLSVNIANIPESEIVSGYRWVVANGKTSADATIDLSTKTILNTTVNVELTTNSEQKYFANTAVRIDKEAPIITDIEVSGGNDWTKGKNLAITATDQKGSGIAGYYVGKESCTETTTFESTADESYNISISAEELDSNEEQFYICVKDKVGNIKSQETKLSMVDNTAPTCVWGGESTSWTKNNRTITLSCEDSESGCAKGYEKFTETFDASTKTTYLSYVIKDRAGNTTTCSKEVNVYVDKTKPTCGKISGASTNWTSSNRTITQRCIDNESGCKKTSYETTYTTSVKQGSVKIIDKAGNSNTCTYNVYVDKTKPTCGKITGASTNWTSSDRTITQSCIDNESGCKKTNYTTTYNTTTKRGSVKISDNVGNNRTCTYNVYVKKAPTITGNINNWHCGKCYDANSEDCTLKNSKEYRVHYNGELVITPPNNKYKDGACGNTMGKVTYTISGSTVTFKWLILQGNYTYINDGFEVYFRIRKQGSSKDIKSVLIKESNDSWPPGAENYGTVKYKFEEKGTYYIYIDGDSMDPSFDIKDFGTIIVS